MTQLLNQPIRPIPPRTLARLRWPSQAGIIRRARCSGCRSRVLLPAYPPCADTPLVDLTCLFCGRSLCELVADDYQRMTPERYATLPKAPTRKPTAVKAPPAPSSHQRQGGRPCPECGQRRIGYDRARCFDCRARWYWSRSLGLAVVTLLADGKPRSRTALRWLLKISDESLRQACRKARARGYVIVGGRTGYLRLEAAP